MKYFVLIVIVVGLIGLMSGHESSPGVAAILLYVVLSPVVRARQTVRSPK